MLKNSVLYRVAKLMGFAAVIPLLIGHGTGGDVSLNCLVKGGCPEPENEVVIDRTKEGFIASISDTSWNKECFPIYNGSIISAYNSSELTIDSSLKATIIAKTFGLADASCYSILTDISYTFQMDLEGKVYSEESITAWAINLVFVESPDISEISSPYSIIYVDSERLYLGQNFGSNLGKTDKTRHSSISLDDYYLQILN
jgi:hypothetical protein